MYGSYQILMTDAFVLHTYGVGEADRIITVLTRDNGVLAIYARSIRKEGAKMRVALQPYGCISLSAVLGAKTILKDVYVTDTLSTIWSDERKYTAFVTLLYYVRLLVPVVALHTDDVFPIVETAIAHLKDADANQADAILLVAQILLLSALGYVKDTTISYTQFSTILKDMTSKQAIRRQYEQYLHDALYNQ